MPRKLKDESGTEIEVFDSTEIEAAKTSAAEAKAKELEQEINPNWKEVRKRVSDLEKENETLKKGEKLPAPSVSAEEVTRIAQEQAEGLYLKRYKDRVANGFGDKKESVEKYAEKLLAGEKLTEEVIDKAFADAARAVGVRRVPNADLSAMNGRSGAAPNFSQDGVDQGFGTTPAGKATAAAMDLIIEAPKK